jgi:hypothetical protein
MYSYSTYLGASRCCSNNTNNTGQQGPQGPAGKGAIGPLGNQGNQGYQGNIGQQGACCRGPQGYQGAPGSQALTQTAPTTQTASFPVLESYKWIICNGATQIDVTLPTPSSSNAGRELYFKNMASFAVDSITANVVPLNSGNTTATTSILPATIGSTATLVSDGVLNWIIMQ